MQRLTLSLGIMTVLTLSIIFTKTEAYAADNLNGSPIEDEFDGLLVDHTITRIGREFFDRFSGHWRLAVTGNKDNLALFERPSARWGSLVWVEYRSKKLYSTFLRPNTSGLDALSANAVQQVHSQLRQFKLTELFGNDPDLAKDEI